MFEFFLILLFAIFLRSAIFFKYKFLGTDTFYHILRSFAIKKNGRKKEFAGKIAKIKELLITPKWWLYYPNLFDIFLSFFSKKQHKYFKFLSIFFDILTLISLYFFVSILFDSIVAIFSSIIYSLSPILILVSIPLSPRTFANLFFVLSNIFLLLYFLNGNILFIFLSSFCVTLICLSHKLTLQSLVIVLTTEALIFKTPIPLIALLLGFLFAMIVTKKFYFRVFKAHIELIFHFIKKGLNLNKKIKELVYSFMSFPFILLILFNPIADNILVIYLYAWFWSLVITAVFWMWGDSYRYMTNAIFPGSILVGLVLSKNYHNVLFLITIALSIIAIIKIYKSFSKPPKFIDNNILKSFNFVRKNSKKGEIIVTIPPQYHLAASYFTGLKSAELFDKEIKDISKTGTFFGRKSFWLISYKKIFSRKFKEVRRFNGIIVYKK